METTPVFAQWDLVLGRTPMLLGSESSRYRNVGGVVAHAGYIIADSHATGTIPGKDLVWAFDFYDHGGNAASTITGFHDVANGSAFLLPCRAGPPVGCGWTSGQGVSLQTYGANLSDLGYGAYLSTMMHETSQTIAIGTAATTTAGLTPQNAPAAMQGNGTYTVAGVFRIDATGFDQVPFWATGDGAATNAQVALSYSNSTGGPLQLIWSNSAQFPNNRWMFNSGFTPTIGSWYFIACTVQANGATPIARMWTGIGGALVDKIAGVSRTQVGSATQTPNVSATPLRLGMGTAGTHHTSASYAGLFVYSRALGRAEVGLMYQTVKAKMAAQGVTLQ
jgi:hypothetical protein